jgi:hypothetical protein
MRNSAWYNKLWRKKLDNYPLKEDADASWAQMHGLLDEHLPVNGSSANKKPGKFFGSTVVSMLGFILPAAAMIGALTYVAVKHPFKNKEVNKHHHYNIASKRLKGTTADDSLNKSTDTLKADSASRINEENLTATNTRQINTIKPATGQQINNHVLFSNNLTRSINRAGNNTGYNNSSPNGITKSGNLNPVQSPPVKTGVIVNGPATNYPATANNKAGSDSVNQLKTGTGNDKENLPKTSATAVSGTGKPGNNNSVASAKVKTGGKIKSSGSGKIKTTKLSTGTSPFDFSISAALNAGKPGSNMVFGLAGIYTLNTKWLLNVGVKMDLNRPLSNTFTHQSYFRPDTSFTINDSRKLNVITVPVTLEYQVSDIISINAGPQLSFSARQSKLSTKLGTVLDKRDTLARTHTIDSALLINSINKINVGISGGISIRLNRFYIDGTYQQNLTPYNVTTGLGGYKQYYRSFQIGLRYKFKKKGL